MIKTLLIANRGEIAARIQKTAQQAGIETVVIYAYPDRHHQYVKNAHKAYELKGVWSQETYLNQDALINIAKSSGADAIHPGYGFLAENAEFAQLCQDNKIIFVGPKAGSIKKMGAKDEAKRIAKQAGVPVIESQNVTLADTKKLKFPVLVKAVHGGGGKGMRIVDEASTLEDAIESAKREAKQAFGNDDVMIEPYIINARHIEVQIFADSHGNAVHLFERDCSYQRKYQKVIEEAPASDLSDTIKAQLYEASINLAKAVGYMGAGTCEYLVSGENFYFLEMNTRLQVEHPVTEAITGEDLVAWQLKVASGHQLPKEQHEISLSGHAIELRITAENVLDHYQPDTGYIQALQWPEEARIDTYLSQGSKISVYYDSMISKLIVHDNCRDSAIEKSLLAIQNTELGGIHHNIPFLSQLLTLDDFKKSKHHTQTIAEKQIELLNDLRDTQNRFACLALYLLIHSEDTHPARFLFTNTNKSTLDRISVSDGRNTFSFQNILLTEYGFSAFILDEKFDFNFDGDRYQLNGQSYSTPKIDRSTSSVSISTEISLLTYKRLPFVSRQIVETLSDKIIAPMTAHVAIVHCQEDQDINKDTPVITLSAMKMEHVLKSPCKTKIKKLHVKTDEIVNPGDTLVEFIDE